VRQFYTAAVQFKFNRRFRESGLLDGVEDLANETQIARPWPRRAFLKVLNLRTQISGAASQAMPNARSLMADVVARGVRVPAAHSQNTMQKFVRRRFSLIVTLANFVVVKIRTNGEPVGQTHSFATWACRH
jgi:hypothetical protein